MNEPLEQPDLEDNLRRDLHDAFDSPAGKRVLRHLMMNFHFFTGMPPGNELQYWEGQRSVVCYILGAMQADLEDPETILQVAAKGSFDYTIYQPKEQD